jgi:transposase InsO family protein
MPEDQLQKTPGDLLATVRFADTRRWSADWMNALFIFERCLVYSGGRRVPARAHLALMVRATLKPWNGELRRRWYDEHVAADANRGLSELVAAHPGNWIVWSSDVVKWDLGAAIGTSRLLLELVDGTRRKVLWERSPNSLPAIRAALHRALAAPASPRSGDRA